MESGTPFLEGGAARASALLQNPPSFPHQIEHSGPWPLGMLSCHGRTQCLDPHVSSFSLLPWVVSVLPVSSPFPFKSFHDFQQMNHVINHSPNLGPIRQDEGLIQSLESKALDGLSLVFRSSDHALSPSDRNRFLRKAFSFLWLFHASFPRPPQEPSAG